MNAYEIKPTQPTTIIFDVDGTMYDSDKLNKYVKFKFVKHYLLNPKDSGEAKAVKEFFKRRTFYANRETPVNQLCEDISKELNLNYERTCEAVKYWAYDAPLRYMKKFARYNVLDFMSKMYRQGHRIIVYSNTPVADKLKVLDITEYHYLFAPPKGEYWAKPSISKMKQIREEAEISEDEEVFYVGDKIDEDGESATFIKANFMYIFDSKEYLGSYYDEMRERFPLFRE